MPCTFDHVAEPRHGGGWRSQDLLLVPAMDQHFVPMTGVDGGLCGACSESQIGMAWGSPSYVLCLRCATAHFGAPDLLFLTPVDDEESESKALTTKRDKDFDPAGYIEYRFADALGGRYGCSGYRCPTYPAPDRIIPANTLFMMGNSNGRGNLCIACFNKLKAQYEVAPTRITCRCCDRRVRVEQTEEVIYRQEVGRVCNSCIAQYYMTAPETDGGWIQRASAVRLTMPNTPTAPGRTIYASRQWAQAHWFEGSSGWFLTEAERDRDLYSVDASYRDNRIAINISLRVFPYGTNVIKMHGFPAITKVDELCFGVELEMQPKPEHSQEHITSILGGKFLPTNPYILCADSSIGSAGVEMITLPYTLANHKSDKYVQWTKILGNLRKVAQSGQNTTACGMHVHINRKALSNLQMGKMLVVINAPEMQELIVTIAQRNKTSYARRFYKKVTEGGKIIGNHGDALNMSNSKGTCELRIFRGNLRYERVMKNLEFAEALCLYASEQSIQKVADPALLVAWLNDNKAHYPHLVKFLQEEYQPTKAFSRVAARARKNEDWESVADNVLIEPTEGDI